MSELELTVTALAVKAAWPCGVRVDRWPEHVVFYFRMDNGMWAKGTAERGRRGLFFGLFKSYHNFSYCADDPDSVDGLIRFIVDNVHDVERRYYSVGFDLETWLVARMEGRDA